MKLHLTLSQGYKIEAYLDTKMPIFHISERLGVHRSSIYRELQRCPKGCYNADIAHKDYLKNKGNKRGNYAKTLICKPLIEKYIQEDQLSPEQIIGKCKKEQVDMISHEAIYQFVYKDRRNGGELYKHLRQGNKRRKSRHKQDNRGVLVNRKSIDSRPLEADNKTEIGHWEADVVIGTKEKSAVLVTLVDRRSKLCMIQKADGKDEQSVGRALFQMYERTSLPWLSITFDNGKEFACHEYIEESCDTSAYFAHPYCSWERGLNENTNGLIRQYFKKGESLNPVTQEEIKKVEDKLNTRPRKTLDFMSPIEFINEDTQENFIEDFVAFES